MKPLNPMMIAKYTRSCEMEPDYLQRKFARIQREQERAKKETEQVVRPLVKKQQVN